MTEEQREILLIYTECFPKKWKVRIKAIWDNDLCHPTLRELRNTIGPSGLDKLTANKIKKG